VIEKGFFSQFFSKRPILDSVLHLNNYPRHFDKSSTRTFLYSCRGCTLWATSRGSLNTKVWKLWSEATPSVCRASWKVAYG